MATQLIGVTKRLPGRRGKHRMKRNWMKLYNTEGAVLRVETVINDPEEFRIRRRVRRHGRSVMAWVPLRKGVAYLSRYQEIGGHRKGRRVMAAAIKLREVAYPSLFAAAASTYL